MSKRTSVFWIPSREEFQKIVSNAKSIADVMRYFGMVTANGSYKIINKRIKEENIDISSIIEGRKHRFIPKNEPYLLEKVMVENSTYSRDCLKKRLIKDGSLKEICAICGMKNEWNGKKLVLVLDHINGINNDHRLENLRLVCPNCDSQTITFKARKRRTIKNCENCGIVISNKSKRCIKCSIKTRKRKVENRPTLEQLEEDLKTMSILATGRKYGVSNTSIKKWIKQYKEKL